MLDVFAVGRHVVVYLGEAHTLLGLLAAITATVFAVFAEEVRAADASVLQRPQHLLLILADKAVDQHFTTAVFASLFDVEALIVVVVGRTERFEVAVVLLYAL